MTEQIKRQIRILLFDNHRYLVKIFNNSPNVLCVEIAVVLITFYTAAVSAMVMDYTNVTILTKVLHEREITLLVFCHSVRKLNNAYGRTLRLRDGNGK